MIVVSDASPIINLSIIGQLELLPKLFGRVVIPTAVFEEIAVQGAGLPGAAEVLSADWVEIKPPQNRAFLNLLLAEKDLHRGEAAAIALAVELHADALIVDDAIGRIHARKQGIPFVGILGILLRAKKKGHLAAVQPELERLKNEANFFISQNLYAEILQLADEVHP